MQLKSVFLFFAIFLVVSTKAQDKQKIESLDTFFGGFPLQSGFNAWVDYMSSNPHIGIDSIGGRGGYSSYKEGIKTHFPFPDSVFVKILLSKEVNIRTGDTAKILSIEGVFTDNKAGRKASEVFYKQLIKELNTYYRNWTDRYYELFFSSGINNLFPNFTVTKGYTNDLGFYYVILRYEYF